MKLSAEQLNAKIAKVLPPIIWISGNEPLLVLESADIVRQQARKQGFSERVVIAVDRYTKRHQLQEHLGSMSLFGDRKLIELRLPTGKLNKDLADTLIEALPSLGDETRVLITSLKLDKTVTQSAWFNEIDRAGIHVPIEVMKRQQLPGWLSEQLAQQGQTAEPALLNWLADKVDGNLLAARQELRKLALLYPPGKLEASSLQAAVMDVARYNAFDVADSMVEGDWQRTLRGIEGLRAEGAALPMVNWAFTDAAHALYRLVHAKSEGKLNAALLGSLRLFGSREQIYRRASDRLQLGQCAIALDLLAAVDRLSKGISDQPATQRSRQSDPWAALTEASRYLTGAALQ